MTAFLNKELIFSKTFTILPDECVSFAPPELQGLKLNFIVREQTEQGDLPFIDQVRNGSQELTILLAGDNGVGFNWIPVTSIGEIPEGPLSGRIFAHSFKGLLQVQIDFHLARRPNYSPR